MERSIFLFSDDGITWKGCGEMNSGETANLLCIGVYRPPIELPESWKQAMAELLPEWRLPFPAVEPV